MTVDDEEDIAMVLEAAAATAPPAVVEAAGAEARRLLGDDAAVRVTRDGDRLVVELLAPEDTDHEHATSVAVRVLGTAQQISRGARTMDVGLGAESDPAD
jgi:hypothetical protein